MTSLVDRYGRIHDYLRISVTDRCNLRCAYCAPRAGLSFKPRDELLTYEEITRVVRVMAELGIRKVRLTGGEPTVRKNIESLVAQIVAVPDIERVVMTTNGVLFASQAKALREAGLAGVNISLDTLRRDRFRKIAGRDEFDHVMDSIDTALAIGLSPLKLNVVIMPKVNDDELLEFVEFVRKRPINVRFIEYMPFRDNGWDRNGFVSYREMKQTIEERHELFALPETFTANRMARDFKISGFEGSVSFIASLTESFCDSCSRIRVTSDGWLKACLFYPAQMGLRETLRADRSDDELKERIRCALQAKPKGHPDLDELASTSQASMMHVGG